MVKDKLLRIPELARILGISRVAVYRKVKAGKIPARKVGRNYVISDRDVAAVLGKTLSEKDKKRVDQAVHKVVRDYGPVLKKLANESR